MIVITGQMMDSARLAMLAVDLCEYPDIEAALSGALNGLPPEAKRELASALLRSASVDEGFIEEAP